MKPLARVSSHRSRPPHQENLPPPAPFAHRRRVRVLRIRVLPALGKFKPAGLGHFQHPDHRNVGQGSCLVKTAKLTTHIAMGAPKPDLFDPAVVVRWRVPNNRRIRDARLVQGKRMKPVAHDRRQFVVMKPVRIRSVACSAFSSPTRSIAPARDRTAKAPREKPNRKIRSPARYLLARCP